MNNPKNVRIVTICVSALILALLLVSFAGASSDYTAQETSTVSIPPTGVITVDQTNTTGVSFEIHGASGASGSVTSTVYSGNPQPTGGVPSGVTLTHFIAVTFNFNPSDFVSANVIIHYNATELQNLTQPYVVYKYIPSSNTFVPLPTVVNTVARTLTVTLTSTTDPLFAIGNAAPSPTPSPTATPSPTVAPTSTPLPTVAPTSTPYPTASPTSAPTSTPAPTTPAPTTSPTSTPTSTPAPTTPAPTATPVSSPTATPIITAQPSVTPVETPSTPVWLWITLVVVIVVIILVATLIVRRRTSK